MNGPLEGVRVVELGGIGPVPFAATVLAELGADVVRVDRPGESNPLALAAGVRRSRSSIAVDLKHDDGIAVVRRLLEPVGNIPPAEAEANYYAGLEEPALAA